MSNEELVILIQSGERERLAELWEQVERLVWRMANHVMIALDGCGKVEIDDLYQSGYPALVAAVDSYNPQSAAFSTWFVYHLKTAFAEATGYRTMTQKQDPLRFADSLDRPLTDEKDSDTAGSLIPDPRIQRKLEAIEDGVYREQLHNALDEAMATLPDQAAEVLRMRYYQDMTLAEIGEQKGTTAERVRRIESKAFTQLHKPRVLRTLWPFYDFNFYCGTGLGTFRRSGASIQEQYLLIQEERLERENRRIQQKARRQAEAAIKEITESAERAAQARVASMTPEEKARLLEKYGLA